MTDRARFYSLTSIVVKDFVSERRFVLAVCKTRGLRHFS